MAGPLTLVSVIASWVAGLVLGFALIFVAAYPAGFRTSTGGVPPASTRVSSAFYYSFETLVTLGYGDLVPATVPTRGVATVEALVGFGLLTASVSSIVLIYPALARLRLLARGVAHLVAAEKKVGVALGETCSDVVLNELAREVTSARIDHIHFPIVYYFAASEPQASLASWTRELVRFAAEGQAAHRSADVRLAGTVLDGALDDLAALLDNRFLHTRSPDRERIFEAFARDHLVDRGRERANAG
jgi:hypothetical protein